MTNETISNENLSWAHPIVQEWFLAKFGSPTEPQELGWPAILAGKTTLISAPTGSGKTFTAFLICIDTLVRKALNGKLENETEVVYISPLKALSNDIHLNLTEPLSEIIKLAKQKNLPMEEIRVAVRTGDTLMKDRQAMLKKRPHILVTTPESFYILLTAEKSRAILKNVKTVIVDEIHALANSKRGTHLALTLERLDALAVTSPLRIGLSATQKPIEKIASFLSGNERTSAEIINIGHVRKLELAIEVPRSELGPIASNEMWDEVYDRLAELALQYRSTLIFVNTRKLSERLTHHLASRLGKDKVAAHHGSLSRKLRLEAETKLKHGELKALVATASLELGIDIGSIDLVCQIGSPRSIAVALQRIGRSGHWHGAISRGHFFATTRDELVECAALIHAIKEGDLDELIIPEQPLDILSQQIVAACATTDWREEDLFNLVKRAYPYKDLSREKFAEILTMLSEGVAGTRGRYGAYLFHDQINGIVKGRRGSRLTAIMSGGAIPDNSLFSVIAEPQGTMVGTLDEDFAVESNRGDIILLGNTSWQIRRIESASGKVIVEDAHGAPPTVPFWRGEAPARTETLSYWVAQLREKISEMISFDTPRITEVLQNDEVINAKTWLNKNCGTNDSGSEQILDYIQQGRAILGAVPTQNRIIAERFFDEAGGMQLVIHSPFGARINKAWGFALRKKFCRSFNFELQAAATDDGITISLTEQHSFPLEDVFHFLHPNTLKETLTQAVLQSPLFPTRWRWDACRSLALVRFRNGRKTPPPILRILAEDLLAAVFPDAAACQDNLGGKDIVLPDHPLIEETMKDVLNEALDLEGLVTLLNGIINKKIICVGVDTPIPSVFSHEILNANPYAFLDDAPLEERRARAVELRRILPEATLKEVGKLDPAVISEVQQQIWPDIRNADELHDMLQTFIALPVNGDFNAAFELQWTSFFNQLCNENRASLAYYNSHSFWVAAEKKNAFLAIYPNAIFDFELPEIANKEITNEEALLDLSRGWLLHLGPTTTQKLSDILKIPLNELEPIFLKLESTGFILRGHFTTTEQLEWCERRLLARIHRLTLGKLRREIKPVTAAQFMEWLLRWQHVADNTQLRGEQGLLEVIRQLQGFEIPANAWESQILKKRIVDYSSSMLDHLCLHGAIGWGRFVSKKTSLSNEEEFPKTNNKKRIIPTSVALITFFVREESDWMPQSSETISEEEFEKLSHPARSIYTYLQQKGASFFADIVRGSGKLNSEVEMGLWELVVAGIVTADSFDNLRALIDPKRRRDQKRRLYQARFSTGRWSLLHHESQQNLQQRTEAICWMLLKRYGVVFRDLVAREKILPNWRELLLAFRRLEDRGEVRGGRFVSGFLGEQFALPYAVDSLRALKKEVLASDLISLSASDPLNLIGIVLSGKRVAASSKNEITLDVNA
jgi:ATP-dependent Lhr-like helicase